MKKDLQSLLAAMREHGQKNPGQWVIPGWDGDSIARAAALAPVFPQPVTPQLSSPTIWSHPVNVSTGPGETIDLVGIKDGKEVPLGKSPMPPQMKLREIMRSYFSGNPDDDDSDLSMAVAAGMEFFQWLGQQGCFATPKSAAEDPVATLWVHPGIGMNGERLHSIKILDWSRLPAEGNVDLHLGPSSGAGVSSTRPDNVLLEYRLVATTRRLTFDILWQAHEVTYMGDDDGPYFSFTASNGYQVISRSRMDIQTERIWLLGAKHQDEMRSGSMVFSSDEKRDAAMIQFVKALDEWAAANGGIALRKQ